MKKKILALSLAVALLAIALVGGTLAWFTDTDEATNTFTVGSIEIVQHEQQRVVEDGVKTEELEDFVNEKVLLPVVNTEDVTADENFSDKIVTVENTGRNEAYVQTLVAVPKALVDADVLEIHEVNTDKWTKLEEVATATIGGLEYYVYTYRYNTALAKGAVTEAVIDGVYINSFVDMDVIELEDGTQEAYFVVNGTRVEGFNALELISVHVATQAVQTAGFGSAGEALEAAFATHPWA